MKKLFLTMILSLACLFGCVLCFSGCWGNDVNNNDNDADTEQGGNNGDNDLDNSGGVTPAHVHSMVKHNAQDATCVATGNIEYYSCSDCGKYFSDADGKTEIAKSSVTTDKIDHNYLHYECTECATTLTVTSSGLTYELNDLKDGYIVTGWTFGSLTATTLVIPETYNNLPVKEIGEKAFYHDLSEGAKSAPLLNITKLYLPDSLEKIGDYAFYDLENLAYLNLGNSVVRIGEGAFMAIESLTKVVIPDSINSIGDAAFSAGLWDSSALESVTIGSGVTYIGSQAFYNCKNLTSVTFKDTEGWESWTQNSRKGTSVSSDKMADPVQAAELMLNANYYWKKS